MNNQELKDKILNILCKSGSVEDMVFDKETIEQISEVVLAIKAKNSTLKKSEPAYKAVISPNGQWSLEKASSHVINYRTMSAPKEDIKSREEKAAKLTYNPKNPTSAPVYTPAVTEKPKEVKPSKEKLAPVAKPALEEIKTRQTAAINEPPVATPKKFKKL